MNNTNKINNRFMCLKPENEESVNYENRRAERPSRVTNSRWERSKSPEESVNYENRGAERSNRFNTTKTNSRWERSKSPEESVNYENRGAERSNRFNTTQTNSRWGRSKSPEKGNSFTAQGRDYNRRNFKNGRNRGRNKISEKFNGIEKDAKGRPMIHNATTSAFNLDFVLQKKSTKSPIRKKTEKKKKKINSYDDIKPKYITNEKTKEEKEKEKEWNRQMILNMQYETDSEQEEESEDDEM